MSKVYESLREYRRNTAAYWLRSARQAFRLAQEFDSRKHNDFIHTGIREMRLYAEWKAKAERAEW